MGKDHCHDPSEDQSGGGGPCSRGGVVVLVTEVSGAHTHPHPALLPLHTPLVPVHLGRVLGGEVGHRCNKDKVKMDDLATIATFHVPESALEVSKC